MKNKDGGILGNIIPIKNQIKELTGINIRNPSKRPNQNWDMTY